MLHHFPQPDIAYPHRIWDYFIAALTFFCVAISLNMDASGSMEQQKLHGDYCLDISARIAIRRK